jgi:cytochrome c556
LISVLVVIVCMITATIYAQGVLKASQSSPEQVVAARKFAMRAMGADVKDLKRKIEAGNIKGVAANAKSIAAIATFLPLVYKKTYSEVYPVKGSKSFFKGVSISGIEAASESLRQQAEALVRLASANDESGVNAQADKLRGACKNCHRSYRGKY